MEEYTQGFDVTQNLQYRAHQCVIDAYEMGLENGIEQGRNEAWEAARKLRLSRVNDPSMAELRDIFSVSVLDSDTDILRKFSASEAVEKIKTYEEQKEKSKKTIGKYVKKPIIVEAFHYDGDLKYQNGEWYVPEWAVQAFGDDVLFYASQDDGAPCELYVRTLEGDMHVSVGDYVIRGINRELYPCKEEIFKATYDVLEE